MLDDEAKFMVKDSQKRVRTWPVPGDLIKCLDPGRTYAWKRASVASGSVAVDDTIGLVIASIMNPESDFYECGTSDDGKKWARCWWLVKISKGSVWVNEAQMNAMYAIVQ